MLLNVSARNGLVVVVPKGFDLQMVAGIVEKKRAWIEKTYAKVEQQRNHLLDTESRALPERLVLRGIGEEWEIEYRTDDLPSVSLEERGEGRLLIGGGIHAHENVKTLLRGWLHRKAQESLEPRLREVADERGFKINKVQVRSQKTRWGSCSSRKNISINLKLLFVPEELIDYVLFHELCHTLHMNHSPEFWTLLEEHLPDCMARNEELKTAWQHVPVWLEAAN